MDKMFFLIVVFLYVLPVGSYGQDFYGGAAVCYVKSSPNHISGMAVQDTLRECLLAYNNSTGELYKYKHSNPAGFRWILAFDNADNFGLHLLSELADVSGPSYPPYGSVLISNSLGYKPANLDSLISHPDNIVNVTSAPGTTTAADSLGQIHLDTVNQKAYINVGLGNAAGQRSFGFLESDAVATVSTIQRYQTFKTADGGTIDTLRVVVGLKSDGSSDFRASIRTADGATELWGENFTLTTTGKDILEFLPNYTVVDGADLSVGLKKTSGNSLDWYGSSNANTYPVGAYSVGTANIKDATFQISETAVQNDFIWTEITSVGGGGGGLDSVVTDATLTGFGIEGDTLKVATPLPSTATSNDMLRWNGSAWVATSNISSTPGGALTVNGSGGTATTLVGRDASGTLTTINAGTGVSLTTSGEANLNLNLSGSAHKTYTTTDTLDADKYTFTLDASGGSFTFNLSEMVNGFSYMVRVTGTATNSVTLQHTGQAFYFNGSGATSNNSFTLSTTHNNGIFFIRKKGGLTFIK